MYYVGLRWESWLSITSTARLPSKVAGNLRLQKEAESYEKDNNSIRYHYSMGV